MQAGALFHAFINGIENSYIENYGEDDLFAIFDLYSEKTRTLYRYICKIQNEWESDINGDKDKMQ